MSTVSSGLTPAPFSALRAQRWRFSSAHPMMRSCAGAHFGHRAVSADIVSLRWHRAGAPDAGTSQRRRRGFGVGIGAVCRAIAAVLCVAADRVTALCAALSSAATRCGSLPGCGEEGLPGKPVAAAQSEQSAGHPRCKQHARHFATLTATACSCRYPSQHVDVLSSKVPPLKVTYMLNAGPIAMVTTRPQSALWLKNAAMAPVGLLRSVEFSIHVALWLITAPTPLVAPVHYLHDHPFGRFPAGVRST